MDPASHPVRAYFLEAHLAPLQPYLLRPDVTDIYVNRPGEIWVETTSGGTERHEAACLDDAHLWRLARQIASVNHQGISRENPLLSATLPDGSRVQIIAPPATRGPMALAIRKHLLRNVSLLDLAAQDVFRSTTASGSPDAQQEMLERLYADRDWLAFLAAAVRARKTVLISGGTSTGKTTLMSALLAEVPSSERLVTIEDTPELQIASENAIGLIAARGHLTEARLTTEELLAAALRMRPDRIIVGEIRGPEAFSWLRAVNTGHPGSISTIHADSPERAIEQMALLVLHTGIGLQRSDIIDYVTNVVDIFVQLDRNGGARRVSHIDWRGASATQTRSRGDALSGRQRRDEGGASLQRPGGGRADSVRA